MKTLNYADDADPAHALDLYLPADSQGPRPVVVWVHGGGWFSGDKSQLNAADHGMRQWRDALLGKGYAVASVNYRLSGTARHPAQLDDVSAAVRYLRRESGNLGLASDRLAVAGESAGGHLALLTAMGGASHGTIGGTQGSGPVQAVLSFYGVTDLTRLHADQAAQPSCPAAPAGVGSPEGKLLGYDPAARRQAALDASPLGHVSGNTPPTYLTHGRWDCTVPPVQSQRLNDALQRAGRPVTLTLIDGSHADARFYTTAHSVDPALQFLAQHLGT